MPQACQYKDQELQTGKSAAASCSRTLLWWHKRCSFCWGTSLHIPGFQETVTLFPSKSCPQVLAFDLYQLILLSLQEMIHGSCTSPPPASALPLNRGSLRICLQCWSLLSLEILWGLKPWGMLDLPLHTTASLERKTAHYSSRQRVKLWIIKLREAPIKWNKAIKCSCTLYLTRFFLSCFRASAEAVVELQSRAGCSGAFLPAKGALSLCQDNPSSLK